MFAHYLIISYSAIYPDEEKLLLVVVVAASPVL
jgi:hypothetical protein